MQNGEVFSLKDGQKYQVKVDGVFFRDNKRHPVLGIIPGMIRGKLRVVTLDGCLLPDGEYHLCLETDLAMRFKKSGAECDVL